VGAATLKPREANIVQTRGADNRLVFAERRQRVGVWQLIKKGVASPRHIKSMQRHKSPTSKALLIMPAIIHPTSKQEPFH